MGDDKDQLTGEARQFQQDFEQVREQIGRVIVGQERVVKSVVTAVLCGWPSAAVPTWLLM